MSTILVGEAENIWEFPKIKGTVFGGPHKNGSYYLGSYIGPNPLFSETPI